MSLITAPHISIFSFFLQISLQHLRFLPYKLLKSPSVTEKISKNKFEKQQKPVAYILKNKGSNNAFTVTVNNFVLLK